MSEPFPFSKFNFFQSTQSISFNFVDELMVDEEMNEAEWRNERSEPGLVAFSSLSFQFSKAIQSKTLIDCSWMKKRKEERPSPPSQQQLFLFFNFIQLCWLKWRRKAGLLAWASQLAAAQQKSTNQFTNQIKNLIELMVCFCLAALLL